MKAGETAAGRMASVVSAASIGITTYNADGDHRRHCCPCGAATSNVMMTMAGKRGSRRRRGGSEMTARQLQGNDEATRMQMQSAMLPQVAGATRQSARG